MNKRRMMVNRISWIMALIAALLVGALLSRPVAAQDKDEPTKAPPTDEFAQPEKTATAAPGQEPTKWPTPFEATKPVPSEVERTPTQTPPAPTIGIRTATREATPEPTVAATRTIEAAIDPVRVIGVVFDDANGNGRRDPDEVGLPGVPVMAESGPTESSTTVTDANGAYTVYTSPDSIVRIVPPVGWRTPGLAALPAHEAGDFPLRKLGDAVSPAPVEAVTAPPAPTVTQSVLDFSGMAIGFAALGAIVWVALLAHQRASVKAFQAWALADLRLRHEAQRETRQFSVETDDHALMVLEQAALDATGARPDLTHLVRDRSRVAPIAAIVAFSSETAQHWVFSPATPDQMKRAARDRDRAQALLGREGWRGVRQRHAIDALNSSPFIADNLAAVLRYLVNDSASPLPRAEQWHVYVITPRKR